MTNLLVLATEGAEGVDPGHVAANISIPLAIVIFVGAIYALVWSNYGAKKGALIYSVAFFGFTFMLGVFWWFGAPGTPVATGLQNFPGQAPDAYQGKWYEFEPGSELAEEYFGDVATGDLEGFEPAPVFLTGREDVTVEELEGNPAFAALNGDLSTAGAQMAELALRVEDGQVRIGGEARAEYQQRAEELLREETRFYVAYSPAEPFYSALVDNEAGDVVMVREANGVRLAAANVTIFSTFDGPEGPITVPVDEQVLYAFKDPGAIWWPSAVWTFVSLLLFALSLLGLDRIERREKEALEEVSEPERLAVPIKQ